MRKTAKPRGPQKPLSLWPLKPEEALKVALETPIMEKSLTRHSKKRRTPVSE